MAGEHAYPEEMHREERNRDEIGAKASAGGGTGQAIAASGAVALTIIGLAGGAPAILLSIGIIAMGAAFLFEGAGVAARFAEMFERPGASRAAEAEFGGGATVEFLGGSAGVVLGILSLLNVYPEILAPIAVIAFGGTMVMGSGITTRLALLSMGQSARQGADQAMIREAANVTAGVDVLAGLGAITLGIIALIGIAPLILSLVGVLTVGFVAMISGGVMSSWIMRVFRR